MMMSEKGGDQHLMFARVTFRFIGLVSFGWYGVHHYWRSFASFVPNGLIFCLASSLARGLRDLVVRLWSGGRGRIRDEIGMGRSGLRDVWCS